MPTLPLSLRVAICNALVRIVTKIVTTIIEQWAKARKRKKS
jgi:hypothetical protein